MTDPLTERQTRAKVWFEELRDLICAEFERLEDELSGDNAGRMAHIPAGRFERKSWERDGGGGGVMEGLEGEEPFLLSRVEGVRQDYHKRYEAQCEGVKAIARRLGWTYSHHKTDHPAEMALLGLYLTLSHTRGR